MIKVVFLSLLLWTSLIAEVYNVEDFESDIFSRNGNRLKKVSLSLRIEGRDLKENDYKITDALNIIISSFYLEDLFTSKGKEQFKKSLSKYLEKKYSVEADAIYLKKFSLIQTPIEIETLISALKEAGYTKKEKSFKKVFDTIPE
jgi:uncharacterized protein (DUF2252 family)